MVARRDNDIEINVTVDSKGAVRALDELGNEIQSVSSSADRASSGISSFQASILTLDSVANLAGRAFDILSTAVTGTFNLLSEAGQIEGVTASFNDLQASVGNVASETLPALQAATQNLIPDFNLLQQANQAVLLGVDDGSGKFAELAEAAVLLGRSVGTDAVNSLNSLVVGVGRQSVAILDNLGVVVKAEQAYESYAQQLGRTAEELTATERKLAFQEAAFEAITEKASKLSGVQETGATATERLGTAFSNLTATLAITLSENEDLTGAINDLAGSLKDAIPEVIRLGTELGNLVSVFVSVGAAAVDFGASLFQGLNLSRLENDVARFGQIFGNEFRKISEELAAGLAFAPPTVENLRILEDQFAKLNDRFEQTSSFFQGKLSPSIARFRELLDDFAKRTAPDVEKRTAAIVAETKGYVDILDKLTSFFGEAESASSKLTREQKEQEEAFKAAEKAARDYERRLSGLNRTIDKAFDLDKDPELVRQLEELIEQGDAGIETIRNLADEAAKTEEGFRTFGDSFSQAKDNVRDTDEALNELLDVQGAFKDGFEESGRSAQEFQDALDGINSGRLEELESVLSGIGSGFDIANDAGRAFSTGLSEIFKQFGAGDQTLGIVGGVGNILGNIIQTGIEGGFDDRDRRDVGQEIGSQLGATAGAIVGSFIPVIGTALGAAIGGIAGAIKGRFFGGLIGRDEGKAARKDLDNFFNELFDENQVFGIVDGKVTAITTFFFNEFTKQLEDGTEIEITPFEDFFNQLDISTDEGIEKFRGFEAVGTALAQKFREVGVSADQLGSIFGTNLGGELNNLQILLTDLGFSAEELQGLVKEAFLAGEISAGKALQEISSINNVFQQGIPEGIGLINKAFDNLVAGAGVGRISLDALGDLGAEAIEKGITGLDQLKDELIASGKSAEEVEKLFDSIAQAGITSIEQLRDVTVDDVLQIQAALEQVGFSFAERAEDIQKLIDVLSGVPESIDTEVNVRVNTQFDENTQLALQNGLFDRTDVGLGLDQ